MNRHLFSSALVLLLLALGEMRSFAQYYPPEVRGTVWGVADQTLSNGSPGVYSGGFYSDYTYEYQYQDGGYWDYSTGYEQTNDNGYWDYSQGQWQDLGTAIGYYDDDGNWVNMGWNANWQYVIQPVWVPNLVTTWVSVPTFVPSFSTGWGTTSAWISATLTIDGSGNVSLMACNTSTGAVSYWNGAYDFTSGLFSGGVLPMVALNTDGSSWSPPPPPPTYPSFGPATIWVDGFSYTWTHTDFTDSTQTSGTDYYGDGYGHVAWFQSGTGNVGGTTTAGVSWTGVVTNGIFENTGAVDARAGDSGGAYLQCTAPEGLPRAVRVDGDASLWNFIGQGSALYHYAGGAAHQRLTIDSTTGAVTIQGSSSGLLYNDNVIWTASEGRDVRAVSIDGHVTQSGQSPSWGPPDVVVNQAIWRYVGTWDGSLALPDTSSPPIVGDHYVGDNNMQRLVVNSSGQVTVTGLGEPVVGTYARQGQQEGTPRVFTVSGHEIYPGDENGPYHNNQPGVGPPAIWVNGVTFSFASSNEDASQLGNWVDTYVDGDHNFVLVSATNVLAFRADGALIWSGNYVPADSNLGNGGIFVVVSGSPRFDVRASSGASLLPPQGSPLNGHPSVVSVDGNFWNFGGSADGTDYYFGASAGQRLWIGQDGTVSFTNTVNSPNLAGQGHLSGSIFVVPQHDLRACDSDHHPVNPGVSPQWGPAGLWVEGVVWSFIGSVSDDGLQIHADYYGGMNPGQVVSVDSARNVAGAYAGVFQNGVFVVNDGADLRALDATGAQVPAIGSPTNSHPASLRIGGLHWNFIGSYGGLDYYSAALGGQRLSIDASGAVVYSDRPHRVNGATGTYADGVFTSTGGGLAFNAGTIGNDLDILGNIVSFGSLLGNAQTAGVTLQFMDDWNTATLQNSLARPQARWAWNRAATNGGSTALPVMQLDTQGRLNLYDPATAATPQVEPTVLLAPGVEAGVQVSKLPKLELSQQTLDSDSSVLTKALGDTRYLKSSGEGQNFNSLTVTGAANLTNATVTGNMTVAGSPVLTQAGADSRYLRNQPSAPVVIVNGATISGASQLNGSLAVTSGATITGETHLNGALNTTGNITSNANAEFKGDVVVESNLIVKGTYEGPPTDRKVIMQAGKTLLIPESGDISMGAYRAGPLPEAVPAP